MITTGSISRVAAAEHFAFLAEKYSGRRSALKEFTHKAPEFVFWIFPDGKLFDAKDAHRKHVLRGFAHILKDEPDCGGFLRGRIVRSVDGFQLVVVFSKKKGSR